MLKYLLSSKAYSIDIGLLILRLGLAALMMPHGSAKLMNYAESADTFPDPLGVGSPVSAMLAITAELFCSGFLLLGLFTRIVLVPLIITMMVVIFIILSEDPFSEKEHALLYLIPYISLFLTGPGRYSVDHLLKR